MSTVARAPGLFLPLHSEHGVVVLRLCRDLLDYVPMLDQLAVLQTEKVRDSLAPLTGRATHVGVGDDEVSVGEDVLDFELQLRILAAKPVHEPDEGLSTVRNERIVLDVAVTDVPGDSLLWLAVDERRLQEVDDSLLVLLYVRHGVGPFRNEERGRRSASSRQASRNDLTGRARRLGQR